MPARSIGLALLLAALGAGDAIAQKHSEPVLPGADGTVCDFVAANAGRQTGAPDEYFEPNGLNRATRPFQDMLLKRAAADIDGDGDIELLDTFRLPAGEYSAALGLPETYSFAQAATPEGVDPNEEVRWADAGRWFYFRDQWRLVQFKDRSTNLAVAVTTYGKTGATFDCKFDAVFEEKSVLPASPAIEAVYDGLIRLDPFEAFSDRNERGGALTENDRRYIATLPNFRAGGDVLSISRETHVNVRTGLFVADMNGDGVKERFARFLLQSGATPPCGAVYLELLPGEGKSAPDTKARDFWRTLQGVDYAGGRFAATCGTAYGIIEVEGAGYLYEVKGDSVLQSRRLSRLTGPDNVLSPVKWSDFTAMHEIVYDRAKDDAQNPAR